MMNEQSDSQYMFMTDEQIAAYERKQADIRASLMTAFPEQKSDKELVQQLRADNARLMEELAAAQATIEQMREALTEVVDADECQDADGWLCFELSAEAYHRADAALALPANLDALHEARAQECERLAELSEQGMLLCGELIKEAAAHRAKKGK